MPGVILLVEDLDSRALGSGLHCVSYRLYHTGHPMPARGLIVPAPYSLAKAVLYLYHMGQPRSFTHGSPYHIYYLPILVIYLHAFDMEHIIYVCDLVFNENSTICFVIRLPYLAIISGMLDIQQIIYVWDLFFQYKFNHDVVW
jgi:hypothetical protein